jgi:chaperonin GroEL
VSPAAGKLGARRVRPGKLVQADDAARALLLRGIDIVADAVGPTLGPCGRHVVLQRTDAGPLVTNDGVTVARSLELLRDPLMNQGVQLVRDVADSAESAIGDGTTTATLLARAMVREGFAHAAAGADPMALKRGIARAGRVVRDYVRAQARPLADGDIERVARLASRDGRIGALVARALDAVGPEGPVRVSDDRAYGIHLDLHVGLRFDNGALAPALLADPVARETAIDRPYVLLAAERITQVRQLVPALKLMVEERAPLLVVADEVSGDALTLLTLNVKNRRIPAVAVKAPMFGEDRAAALQDIAVATGGRVLGPTLGRSVERAGLDALGRAERVVVTPEATVITGPAGDPTEVAARAAAIQAELAYLESDYEREKRRVRLARLRGTVAELRVGLDTQAEQEETRHRIQDALHAARAATRGGTVPGGGATLLHAAAAVRESTGSGLGAGIGAGSGAADRLGAAIVATALEVPLRQLAANAGLDPSLAAARVRGAPPGHGLDVERDELVDLTAVGIIDPAELVCSTIEIATSMAGVCLLSELIVAARPLPRQPRRHHGHGHDHEHWHSHAHADHEHSHSHKHAERKEAHAALAEGNGAPAPAHGGGAGA